MPRYAYQMRIRPGKEAEYDEVHRHVWPELLAKLKELGVSRYSIFRRGRDLILTLTCEDLGTALAELDRDPVNLKWQSEMAQIFDEVPGLKPGERFAMMEEVFYLD